MSKRGILFSITIGACALAGGLIYVFLKNNPSVSENHLVSGGSTPAPEVPAMAKVVPHETKKQGRAAEDSLTKLARRTRPRIPPLGEIFRPAHDWEIAIADLDLENTIKLLRSGRLSEDQRTYYADGIRYLTHQGDIEATAILADLIADGVIESEDPGEALRHALIAAEAGNPESAMIVARLVEQGVGGEADPLLAREWYTYAAEMGIADAWAEIGFLDSLGMGSKIDNSSAVALYRHAYANGSALGARRLGLAYAEGWGVEADPKIAQEWFEIAGNMGDPIAYMSLRQYALAGILDITDEAVLNEYVIAAARLGNPSAIIRWAQQRINEGGTESQEGVDDLIDLAREGNPTTLTRLARLTLEDASKSITQRLDESLSLLLMADELGEPEAALRIATLKSLGLGRLTEFPDLAPAREWLERSLQLKNSYEIRLMLAAMDEGMPDRLAIQKYLKTTPDEAYVEWVQRKDLIAIRPNENNPSERVQPVVIQMVTPTYPTSLRSEKISGSVKVGLIILEDGSVGDVFILESSHPAFSESAEKAASEWKFRPATVDGKPSKSRVRLDIPFNVRD